MTIRRLAVVQRAKTTRCVTRAPDDVALAELATRPGRVGLENGRYIAAAGQPSTIRRRSPLTGLEEEAELLALVAIACSAWLTPIAASTSRDVLLRVQRVQFLGAVEEDEPVASAWVSNGREGDPGDTPSLPSPARWSKTKPDPDDCELPLSEAGGVHKQKYLLDEGPYRGQLRAKHHRRKSGGEQAQFPFSAPLTSPPCSAHLRCVQTQPSLANDLRWPRRRVASHLEITAQPGCGL